jgi:hypothetical protein
MESQTYANTETPKGTKKHGQEQGSFGKIPNVFIDLWLNGILPGLILSQAVCLSVENADYLKRRSQHHK